MGLVTKEEDKAMSAAPTESESMAGWSPAKKARKRREQNNRIVLNLSKETTFWLRNEADRRNCPPAQMARALLMELLKERGITEARLKAEFLAAQAEQAQAALEAEQGSPDA